MDPQNHNVIYVKHIDLSRNDLLSICHIKSLAWHYSVESQIEWINKNINPNDLHVMLWGNNKLLAYMSLTVIEVIIDGVKKSALGLGSVCSLEKGKGYGSILMNNVNNYLFTDKKIGLLFCKKELTKFYSMNHWKLIDKEIINLSVNNADIEAMIYNVSYDFSVIGYSGKLF